jgi:hypothetical protein
MEAYRRLSRARRLAFWIAVLVYCTTLPVLILDVFGVSVRLQGSKPFLATGALTLGTRPEGSDVRLDGRRAGRTPLTLQHVTPGDHRIEIRRPRVEPWRGSVSIFAGQVTSIQDLPFAAAPARVLQLATFGPPTVLRSPGGPFYLVLNGGRPPQVLDLRRGLSDAPLLKVQEFSGRAVGARTVGDLPGFLVEMEGPNGPGVLLVYRTLIGEWTNQALPYRLPEGVPLLEASALERSVTYLTAEAAVRRSPDGDRVVHPFHSPVWAWGMVEGRVVVLDRGGVLYHFRGLLPAHETALCPPPSSEVAAWGRIVAVRGGQVALIARGSLYLADATRHRLLGPASGAVDEPRRQRIVLWSDHTVGQVELHPLAGENRVEPQVEWLLTASDPVLEVVPLQGGDACLVRTRRELLLACLTTGIRLVPIPVAALEVGASPALPDAAGYAVLPGPGGLRVLDVEATRGEPEGKR